MSRHGFIAVDLGAQSGRVMLGVFTRDTFELTEIHRFDNRPRTTDGSWCWDVHELFTQTITGLAMAHARAAATGIEIAGIGVDSWGVDYALIDKAGALTAPVRHYRAAAEADHLAARALIPAPQAYAITGIIDLPINTCFQLFRDARTGLLDDGDRMLLIPDLWVLWLTGSLGAERTIASTTGLIDQHTGDWSDHILDALAIPRRILPELVAPGASAGVTTGAITTAIGARRPIPVWRVGGHDTASAFAAVTGADPSHAVISCGTWALAGTCLPHPVLTDDARRAGFTNEAGVDRATTFIRNLSGTWLLEECLSAWHQGDDRTALRDALLLGAAQTPPDRLHGTIDVGDPGLLGPGDMPARIADRYRDRSGDLTPLERHELVRLIIDSLAASFAETIEVTQAFTHSPVTALTMIGGGSQIALLTECTERSTGLPVRIGHPEATSLGNITVQAAASGMMPLAAARERVSTAPRECR